MKSLTAGHLALGVSGTTTCTPFPPDSIGKLDQAEVGQRAGNVERGLAHRLEVQPLVGIEVEDHPVGGLDILDPAAPAVELDRPHLHAIEDALGIVEPQIVLAVPVLLLDRHVMDMLAERPGIVLLEEAMLGTPLRTAHQADRPMAQHRQHDRRDGFVERRELALGDAPNQRRSRGRDW